MSSEHPEPSQRRTRLILAICAGVVVLLAAVIAVIVDAEVGNAPAPSDVAGASSSPSPTAPDATATPSPQATAPAEPRAPLTPADPVPLEEEPEIVPGVTASIAKLEAVQGEAFRPGEVAGPAVRVTVQIANTTNAAVSLVATVVTAYSGTELAPALELGAPGAKAMPNEVAPGATATGVYVFTVPPEQRDHVRIMVDYSVDVPPVVFEGPAPA